VEKGSLRHRSLWHKAAFQVDIMAKLLQDLNKYQEKLGLNLTKLYHITSLTTDNTSSNTGEKNGVRAVLERARAAEWLRDGQAGTMPPLIFKGCEDHITNLVSTEIEKRLVSRAISWGVQGPGRWEKARLHHSPRPHHGSP